MQSNAERAVTIMARLRPFRFRAHERRRPSPRAGNLLAQFAQRHPGSRAGVLVRVRTTLPCRVPFFPYCNAAAMAFLLVVIALMAAFPDTRIAVIVGPIWIAMVTAIFFATQGQRAGTAATRPAHRAALSKK